MTYPAVMLHSEQARSQLRSASEREAVLLSEKDSQASKIHELNGLLAKLSSDLSDVSKVSRDRLIQSEASYVPVVLTTNHSNWGSFFL